MGSFCCSVLSVTPPFVLSFLSNDCDGCFFGDEENLGADPGSTPLCPGNSAQFGCHLIADVESRTVQSIETGTLAFYVVR